MARYFNYLENKLEFKEAYYICKKIISDIINFDITLLDETDKTIVLSLQKEITILNKTLDLSPYNIENTITEELLNPKNIEYADKYKKYPQNASKTGEKYNQIFNRIFEIEDKMQIITAKIWKKVITPFKNIKNGEKFIIVGHSGAGYIVTHQSKYYRNNDYSNTTTYSCSVFTTDSMNCFNSNLVIIFDVTPENFISASHFDSATRTGSFKSVKALKIIDENKIITVGYSSPTDESRIVTKSESPISIIAKITKENDKINEVVLDKEKSNAVGLVLFSNGHDFLFFEYLNALKMKAEYNLELKVINKALYKDIPISFDEINKTLLRYEEYILNLNLEYDELCILLDGYINEVIIPLKLNPEIEQIHLDFIEQLKEKSKKLQY